MIRSASIVCFFAAACIGAVAVADDMDDTAREVFGWKEFTAPTLRPPAKPTDLGALLAAPTPWPKYGGSVLEITLNGNVAFPGRPLLVQVIVDPKSLEFLPERCKSEAKDYPAGTAFVCMSDDALWQKLHPSVEVQH